METQKEIEELHQKLFKQEQANSKAIADLENELRLAREKFESESNTNMIRRNDLENMIDRITSEMEELESRHKKEMRRIEEEHSIKISQVSFSMIIDS